MPGVSHVSSSRGFGSYKQLTIRGRVDSSYSSVSVLIIHTPPQTYVAVAEMVGSARVSSVTVTVTGSKMKSNLNG